MKHKCPHCNKKVISNWGKFNSSALHPAICPNCGGYSKQHYAGTALESLLVTFGVPVALLWSLLAKTWWPVFASVLVVISSGILKFLYVPMVAVDLQAAKNYHWFAFGCLVIVLAWVSYEALGS
ncbi:hypothetical protein Misp06_04470 [Microbulbifer sp. NBRC 101763]